MSAQSGSTNPRAVGQAWGEQDALTTWRRRYVYLTRPGVTSRIKRRVRRRERREATRAIRDEGPDG